MILLILLIVIVVAVVAISSSSRRTEHLIAHQQHVAMHQHQQQQSQRRPCPNCGEDIAFRAKQCRFCNITVQPLYTNNPKVDQQIFMIDQMVAGGLDVPQITRELNTRGIVCLSNEGDWDEETVSGIVKNFHLSHSSNLLPHHESRP